MDHIYDNVGIDAAAALRWILPTTAGVGGFPAASTQAGGLRYDSVAPAAYLSDGLTWLRLGSVISVAASISGALSVSGSPITSAGILAFTWTGSNLQYVKGDGTLGTYAAGGGGSVTEVSAGAGMNFTSITGIGDVILGTPSSITLASINSVSVGTHTHAFAPGGTIGQYIRGDGSLATSLVNQTLSWTAATTALAISGGNTVNVFTLTSLATNDIVRWNGTNWVNFAPTWTTNVGTVTSVSAGNGMTFTTITTSGAVTMGTPSSITLSSTNSVAAGTHSHALALGGTSAQYLRGDNTLATFPTIPVVNWSDKLIAFGKTATSGLDFNSYLRFDYTTFSLTIGSRSAGTEGNYGATIGLNNVNSALYTLQIGSGNTNTSGNSNLNIGSTNSMGVSVGSLVVGASNSYTGNYGVIVGSGNTVSGNTNYVFGSGNNLTGASLSFACGTEITIANYQSVAFGYVVSIAHDGVFAATDSAYTGTTASTVANQFITRFGNGYKFMLTASTRAMNISSTGKVIIDSVSNDNTSIKLMVLGASNEIKYRDYSTLLSLTAGTGISVTGTYPNITITNTLPALWTLDGGGTVYRNSKVLVNATGAAAGSFEVRVTGTTYSTTITDTSGYSDATYLTTKAGGTKQALIFRGIDGIGTAIESGRENNSDWSTFIAFFTNNVTGGSTSAIQEKVRISSNGYLGINTNAPSTYLDVNGGARIRTITQDDALTKVLVADSNGYVKWRNYSTFGGSGGPVWKVQGGSTDATTNTQYIYHNGRLAVGDYSGSISSFQFTVVGTSYYTSTLLTNNNTAFLSWNFTAGAQIEMFKLDTSNNWLFAASHIKVTSTDIVIDQYPSTRTDSFYTVAAARLMYTDSNGKILLTDKKSFYNDHVSAGSKTQQTQSADSTWRRLTNDNTLGSISLSSQFAINGTYYQCQIPRGNDQRFWLVTTIEYEMLSGTSGQPDIEIQVRINNSTTGVTFSDWRESTTGFRKMITIQTILNAGSGSGFYDVDIYFKTITGTGSVYVNKHETVITNVGYVPS